MTIIFSIMKEVSLSKQGVAPRFTPYIHTMHCTDFHYAVSALRAFFLSKGRIEVHPQSRLSILAACEDPTTVSTFRYHHHVWPLPQTGQMWLEHELLRNPQLPGVFCVTTSYRNEPNPIPGRHETIFPMFEFETHGGIEVLHDLEIELITALWLTQQPIAVETYDDVARFYQTSDLTAAHELRMQEDFGEVMLLTHFPHSTSPFRNMKNIGDHAAKIDVIAYGMETIWSAERSTNVAEMRESFHTISDGGYAQLLYNNFTKERVEAELENFLSYDFFPRCGGGIGMTRMIRAMRMAGQLPGAHEIVHTWSLMDAFSRTIHKSV